MILLLGLAVLGFAFWEIYLKNPAPGTVAGYAQNAGFTGFALVEAVAIAFAESGGDPNAVGDVDVPTQGAKSIGLWQINTYYHPEFSEQELYDPQTNANAAFSVYQAAGNSFSPWSTFNSGKYAGFLDQANTDVDVLGTNDNG